MVPAGNAPMVLSNPPQADHIPPLKISGIKRYNAIDGTFYDAINIEFFAQFNSSGDVFLAIGCPVLR